MRPDAAPSSSSVGAPSFGALLKHWRSSRKHSQLELALEARVSQRHISFLESGRAQPSREMILHLAEALAVPLRARNQLLHAAGFAPLYQERALDSSDMASVRRALELTLRHHEPYPALVVNRQWELVLKNDAADRLVGLVGDPASVWQRVDPTGGHNVMRLTFHPAGLQPLVRNWGPVATLLLARLQREVAAYPGDAQLRQLLDDLCSLPPIPSGWRSSVWEAAPPPILQLELEAGGRLLRVFSMISTFGTALDITAEELRVETFFPGDEFTAEFFRGQGTPPLLR